MLPPSQPHTSRDYLQIDALVILDARLRSEDASNMVQILIKLVPLLE
jgi:hypothetical protein